MYLIITYDVAQERVAKVCHFLRRYLHWVQNSVFEGEITEAQFMQIKRGLCELINPKEDSIYFYILKSERYVNKEVLGQSRGSTDLFIE